jgi:N-acetylmuramoyl-L-alanine amidase
MASNAEDFRDMLTQAILRHARRRGFRQATAQRRGMTRRIHATVNSPNHDARPLGVQPSLIILHYTGMRSAAAAIARLCDPVAAVSAHYVIGEDGLVSQLVAEERRAWHAGLGGWRDISDINGHSIGIELVNPGHDWGYRPFPGQQIEALIELASTLREQYRLSPAAVIGHSDTAPARKIDPGELFPWADLAAHGLGIWPRSAPPRDADPATALSRLAAIGYCLDLPDVSPAQLIAAFQRHWRQARVDGVLDAETMGVIEAVARLSREAHTPT